MSEPSQTNGDGPQQPQTGDGELAEWRRIANEGSSAGECSGGDLRALIARLDSEHQARFAAAEAEVARLRPLVEAVVVWDIADDEWGNGGNTLPAVALDGVKAALTALTAPPKENDD